jgi:hypothetical protein
MSGPKSYSPPPRYSISVFNGKLNQAFQLQTRLKKLLEELENFQINDVELNIHFDCSAQLKTIRNQINTALKNIVFDYKGTFGQGTYNKIDLELAAKITTLTTLITESEKIKNDFVAKNKDYTSFVAYSRFFESSLRSFNNFKSEITNYLKKNILDYSPEMYREAERSIGAIKFELTKENFSFEFHSKQDNEKNRITDHIIEKEESINKIRMQISNSIISLGNSIDIPNKSNIRSANLTLENVKIVHKIQEIINKCDDPNHRYKYQYELKKLIESNTLNDLYFFKEMHDSILDNEKTRKGKAFLNVVISDLNNLSVHSSMINEHQLLIEQCLLLLNNSGIDKGQLDCISRQSELFQVRNNLKLEEDEIKSKERLFLKSQLILLLENQGYEVMDDLQVIDFDKTDDFLLKIKGQENYINVKFREDGSMRYVFQIPENKEDLSTDQVKNKLHEMHVTCNEFHNVLNDLSQMGLKLNVTSEKPIELNSIITVTNQYKEKIKSRPKSAKREEQFKKNYLN